METYFASPERASREDLRRTIDFVDANPVFDGLLHSIGGLLAVLNEHRQILAVNDSFLETLGINDPAEVLGLRPGEAVGCVHAGETEAGCGTTRFCSTCGAAISIVSAIEDDTPMERFCALTAVRGGEPVNMSLSVRSQPIRMNGDRYVLLFLQDVTRQQQLSAMERVFRHDINNLMTGMVAASEILMATNGGSREADRVHRLNMRMMKEIAMQKALLGGDDLGYQPLFYDVPVRQVLEELEGIFEDHPVTTGKTLRITGEIPELTMQTDISLVLRVMRNMVVNAFEATEAGGEVRLSVTGSPDGVTFEVWNEKVIPADVARRVFQPFYSTSQELGRGFGTYSMRLFGEKFLGGKVDFSSGEGKGTTFIFRVPG